MHEQTDRNNTIYQEYLEAESRGEQHIVERLAIKYQLSFGRIYAIIKWKRQHPERSLTASDL